MNTKTQTFMPAPRPTARTSPEDAAKLLDATSDLGFTRPSTEAGYDKLSGKVREEEQQRAAVSAVSAPKTSKAKERSPSQENSKTFEGSTQSIRIDVSDEAWKALKMASIDRRVSMKYLMLEALSKQGYPVDLSAVAEDGRRQR